MASIGVRIETLSKENYDTWKMQMQALLIKNDAWTYVSGETKKPILVPGDEVSESAVATWSKSDGKAKSDIILSISPSELKQVKGCETSSELWLKLERIYQSKGPARKATLLKQLTLQRMEEGGDVREHNRRFFDAVDKLSEMEVSVNEDLLAIMLLYSLPASFENFRCAIESRDELPSPESLRLKIIEESDARRNDARREIQGAMVANSKNSYKRWTAKKNTSERNTGTEKEAFKFQCHRCRKFGHKAADCRQAPGNSRQFAKGADGVSLYASLEFSREHEALRVEDLANEKWCLDSGATSHLCKRLDSFANYEKSNYGKLNLANNASADISAKGTVRFTTSVRGQKKDISLSDTLYVPDLRANLLSVAKITNNGFDVKFDKNSAVITDSDGNVKMIADRVGELYYVREDSPDECKISESRPVLTRAAGTLDSWHRRLGHVNAKDILEAVRNGTIQGIDIKQRETEIRCDTCVRGKMIRAPFPTKSSRKTTMLEIIHSDICGPMRTTSHGKAKYMATFIDDSTKWCEVRFLKSKDEVFQTFKDLKQLIENQKGRKIKYLQSDNGGEYKSQKFDNFLRENGIGRRLSVARNPEQNGVAERKNRTLLDTARCLLIQSGLPESFWAEAVNTANYIRNRCPTKSLNGVTPYEAWTGRKPNVKHFREFGCRVQCLNREPARGKLEPRCREGIFVGYSEESKAYRVWLPNERRIEVTRDVKFWENDASRPSESDTVGEEKSTPPEIGIDLTRPEETPNEAPSEETEADNDREEFYSPEVGLQEDTPRISAIPARGRGRPRLLRTGLRGRPRKLYHEPRNTAGMGEENYALISEIPLKQAMLSPHADEWRQAMAAEVRSIIRNDTWELVPRPSDCDIIGSRMVLRNKYRPDGSIERRKARIVAQGFSQRPGVHFNQTFAPVARMSSIRLLVALAARFRMAVHQLDVTTAYLNGVLDEKIFMSPPKRLDEALQTIIESEASDNPIGIKAKRMLGEIKSGDRVCLLKKSLYGLRQAGKCWHAKLDSVLRRVGATPCHADPCMYRIGRGRELLLIAIYVDDILIASRNINAINRIKTKLSNEFEVKDLGDVDYCLGIQFSRVDDKIVMHQRGYIEDLLSRFGMTDSKPVSTPIDLNVKLSRPVEPPDSEIQAIPYRELIGALMYLAVATRPDIAFTVSCLSQFNDSYGGIHWTAAKRVLRYLKGSMDLGLVFGPHSDPLQGFVDADWGNCPVDRRSYTGYVFTLGKGAISWEARKQRTVALSSTEAEYMSLTEAAKEAMYLRSYLIELGFQSLAEITVFNDNMGAKKLALNPIFHARSKHIDLRHHFVREALHKGILRIDYLPTEEMPADLMTKGLPGPKHVKCSKAIGICTATA